MATIKEKKALANALTPLPSHSFTPYDGATAAPPSAAPVASPEPVNTVIDLSGGKQPKQEQRRGVDAILWGDSAAQKLGFKDGADHQNWFNALSKEDQRAYRQPSILDSGNSIMSPTNMPWSATNPGIMINMAKWQMKDQLAAAAPVEEPAPAPAPLPTHTQTPYEASTPPSNGGAAPASPAPQRSTFTPAPVRFQPPAPESWIRPPDQQVFAPGNNMRRRITAQGLLGIGGA